MKKNLVTAVMALALVAAGAQAQENTPRKAADYKVTTFAEEVKTDAVATADDEAAEEQPEEQLDFISRNFQYHSLCNWTPGMRFMVVPSQKDLAIKSFASFDTGKMVSTYSLKDKILVYDGHTERDGSLHDRINFYVQDNSSERYFFEVPTATFADYCYGKVGVPALAYLEDVDRAIDSLVGKRVKLLMRRYRQDSDRQGSSSVEVDLGDPKDIPEMVITKVGVGTRKFPVKIVVSDGKNQYFQNVAISRTNCGLRDDEFEVHYRENLFRNVFELLDDKMAVHGELAAMQGQTVYTFLPTKMMTEGGELVQVKRLSVFTVEEIYTLGGANNVTLILKGQKTGQVLKKEVHVAQTAADDDTELLSALFVVGDPTQLPNIRQSNLKTIQAGKVAQGFNEDEVRLALGEPSEVEPTRNGIYRWKYTYTDTGRPYQSVTFRARTHTVSNATR